MKFLIQLQEQLQSQPHHQIQIQDQAHFNQANQPPILCKHKKSYLIKNSAKGKFKKLYKGFQSQQITFSDKPYISWEVDSSIIKKKFTHNQIIFKVSHWQLTNIISTLKYNNSNNSNDSNNSNNFKEYLTPINYLTVPDQIKNKDKVNWMRQQLAVLLGVKRLERLSRYITLDQITWFLIKNGVKSYRIVRDNFAWNNQTLSIPFIALYTERLLYLNKYHQKFVKTVKKLGLEKLGIHIDYEKPIYLQLCLRLYNSCCRYYNISPDYFHTHQQGDRTHLSLMADHLVFIQIDKDNQPTIIDFYHPQCEIKPQFGQDSYLTLLKNNYPGQQLMKINKKYFVSDQYYILTPITINYNQQLQKLELTDAQSIQVQMQQ